ncbi:UNVERIFIED_CONTAM: hypothetical protein NY603_26250, partial [Bacteroidetes bacterium 56_B9]
DNTLCERSQVVIHGQKNGSEDLWPRESTAPSLLKFGNIGSWSCVVDRVIDIALFGWRTSLPWHTSIEAGDHTRLGGSGWQDRF